MATITIYKLNSNHDYLQSYLANMTIQIATWQPICQTLLIAKLHCNHAYQEIFTATMIIHNASWQP